MMSDKPNMLKTITCRPRLDQTDFLKNSAPLESSNLWACEKPTANHDRIDNIASTANVQASWLLFSNKVAARLTVLEYKRTVCPTLKIVHHKEFTQTEGLNTLKYDHWGIWDESCALRGLSNSMLPPCLVLTQISSTAFSPNQPGLTNSMCSIKFLRTLSGMFTETSARMT